MKKWYLITALILSFFCTAGINFYNKYETKTVQSELAEEVLRFHVRANSDSEEDQKRKMQVKAAVVSHLQPLMEKIDSMEEARLLVENHLPEIEQIIHEQLNEADCAYGFHIKIGKELFPQKTYGDCTFPEGTYEAVIISLGEGKGQNWWCMIYPGLCFFDETYAVVSEESKESLAYVLTEEAYEWVTEDKDVKVKFRLQWLNDLFHIK